MIQWIITDTENEVNDDDQDYEIILKRLTKLEKVSHITIWTANGELFISYCTVFFLYPTEIFFQQVARNRKRDTETSEMNTKVTLAVESVNEMKRTVDNVVINV